MGQYRKRNYEKQGGRCLWCGRQMIPQWDVKSFHKIKKIVGLPEWAYQLPEEHAARLKELYTSVEHIHEKSKGGINHDSNYAASHVVCNRKRNHTVMHPNQSVMQSFSKNKQKLILMHSSKRTLDVKNYAKNVNNIKKALRETKDIISENKKSELSGLFIKHFGILYILKQYFKIKFWRKS